MKPNSHFADGAVAYPDRQLGRRMPIQRYVALIVVACASAGCAHDVALENPQTGATLVCRESAGGFNPWSQTMGCVADHVARGWTTSSQK